MTRAMLAAILIATMVLVTAAAASAYQTHKINYVKVGMTDDGRPVYIAIIQMTFYLNLEFCFCTLAYLKVGRMQKNLRPGDDIQISCL